MEIFKDIIEYNGMYQVSNQGRVKSLWFGKEKILKQSLNVQGYCVVCLHKNGEQTKTTIHQLVAIAFLGHIRCGYKLVVNHIDFNKANNFVDNLEIVTARENSNRKHIKSSSQYVGVSWYKRGKKWRSDIRIQGQSKYLGMFSDELEASNAYQTALNK